MLTDRQLEAAERALKDHKSRELQRRIMLRIYRQCQKTAERLQLPFRMLYRREFPPDEVQPNDFFPHLSRIGRDEQGNPYTIPDAVQVTQEQARYYFTRLLVWNQANLSAYRLSDWTGEAITKQEAERLKRGYFERIQAYKDEPGLFDHEPHPLPPDAKERYFLPDAIT